MSGGKTYKNPLQGFRRDPNYLLRYYATLFVLTALAILPLSMRPPEFYVLDLKIWHLWLVPLGVLVGIASAMLIHNAAHGSIKPVWINKFIGELCGLHQLYGFRAWTIAHLIHHQYPDDPEKDPHAPNGMRFIPFLWGMQRMLRGCLKHNYEQLWGADPRNMQHWKLKNLFGFVGMWARMLLWFLLLGPNLFLCFYLTSYVANVVFFAHFNYFTHRLTETGEIEIQNLNDGIYYKIVNALFLGIYFHKNHHLRPSYADPRDFTP